MNYEILYELLDYEKLNKRLNAIVHNPNNKFPVIEHECIGKSSSNFPIPYYSIGEGSKHIVIFGGVHGNEIIGVDYVTQLMYNLALGKGSFQNFSSQEYTIDFLPLINPDGFYTTTYALNYVLTNDLESFAHTYFLNYKHDDKLIKNINDLLKDICKKMNILNSLDQLINKFWLYFYGYSHLTPKLICNFLVNQDIDVENMLDVIKELFLKYFAKEEISLSKKHQEMFNEVTLDVIPELDENHRLLKEKLSYIYKDKLVPLHTLANFYANSNGVNLNDNNLYYYEIFKNKLKEEKVILAKGRENNILISMSSSIGMPNYDMQKPFKYEIENEALLTFIKELNDEGLYYASFNCHGTGGLLYAKPINNQKYLKINEEKAQIYIQKINEVYHELLQEEIHYEIMPKGKLITGVGDMLREEYPLAFLLELSKMGGNPLGPYGDKEHNYTITMFANFEALMSFILN